MNVKSALLATTIGPILAFAALPSLAQHTGPAIAQAQPEPQRSSERPQLPVRPPAIVDQTRARRLEDLQGSRTESREEGRTTIREGNRIITREGDRSIIRHDDLDRFRGGGREVSVQQRGREVVTTVARPDRTRVVTVVDGDGRLMRRSRLDARGRETVIIDNRRARGQGSRPFVDLPPPAVRIPLDRYVVAAGAVSAGVLYETLRAPPVDRLERAYALDEIRYSSSLRDRMRRIDIDTLTFDTGSWEVKPDQAAQLEQIADAMRRAVKAHPAELFLIEGHTDAVGSDIDNLSLSDRRAEAVAATLSERFAVPPENLVTQGYGEEFPKIATEAPERENRRVAVRRITPLMTGKAAR